MTQKTKIPCLMWGKICLKFNDLNVWKMNFNLIPFIYVVLSLKFIDVFLLSLLVKYHFSTYKTFFLLFQNSTSLLPSTNTNPFKHSFSNSSYIALKNHSLCLVLIMNSNEISIFIHVLVNFLKALRLIYSPQTEFMNEI